MLLMFALSAAVQYNDPDPIRWIAVYGAAAAFCGAALAGRGSRVGPLALMLIALAWAALWAPGVLGRARFADIFAEMEVHDPLVEETREMLGLLIVATWMAVLAWRGAERRGDGR